MNTNFEIDFIVPWVDGSDPQWIAEFNKYCPEDKRLIDVREKRYRDYGLLKYWFRGIEKFAPWVRKLHFVTCGQKPEWLNLDAPKLHWVKHEDYIPQKYLPVFNANPIEMYMHHIPDLAEHFVYFNDDVFLTAPIKDTFFFKNGLPCDAASLDAITYGEITHMILNDTTEINRCFQRRTVFQKHFCKWMNLKYGVGLLRTLCLWHYPYFTGFYDFHFAQPYLKSTLEEVWKNCEEKLSQTMNNRFRSNNDVNQYLFRYWQLCSGNFYPTNLHRKRKYLNVSDPIELIVQNITSGKYSEIILNDNECDNFDERMRKITNAFERILPDKSKFEL